MLFAPLIDEINSTPNLSARRARRRLPLARREKNLTMFNVSLLSGSRVWQSFHYRCTAQKRKSDAKIDPLLETQFSAGRLYAAISSRPGQSGRSDGYILEGKELEVGPTVSNHLHCLLK